MSLDERLRKNMTAFPIKQPWEENKKELKASGSLSRPSTKELSSRVPSREPGGNNRSMPHVTMVGDPIDPMVFSSSQVYGVQLDGMDDPFPTIQSDFAPIYDAGLKPKTAEGLRSRSMADALLAQPPIVSGNALEQDDDGSTVTAPSLFQGLDGGRAVFGGEPQQGVFGKSGQLNMTRTGTGADQGGRLGGATAGGTMLTPAIGFDDDDSISVAGVGGRSQLNQMTSQTDEVMLA